MKPDILIWARDESGNRHLCSMNSIHDASFVNADEVANCVDHDDRLESRRHVPSNDPDGKIKFAQSASLN